jgi:phospholipid/cholesterol/gamma-HCH transport system substrate-binding protein
MMLAIRKHLRDFAAIAVLAAIALAAAGYILQEQGFRLPVVDEEPFELRAAFTDAGGVKPGQNQAVRMAGVRIGEISDVELEDGRAILTLSIEKRYSDRIHRDATALLRPRTGLEDMFVELDPGTEQAAVIEEDHLIRIGDTLPDVDSEQILNQLDARTRDYLKLLVNGGGAGLEGRASDLRDLLRRLEPLHRDIARVNGALARQRQGLRRLVHNYGELTAALGRSDDELATLVSASNEVFDAFASQDTDISTAVARLPGALNATETALAKVDPFADELGPAIDSLRPAFRRLDEANDALRSLARATTPAVRDEIRPFARRAQPFLDDLRPGAGNLATAMPDLDKGFEELNRFFNMGAFNPNGAESVPGEGQAAAQRDEGYLFWLGWVAHDTNSMFSTSDASGPFRRSNFAVSCDTLRELVAAEAPPLEAAFEPILSDTGLCPTSGGEPLVPLPEVPGSGGLG